MIVNVNLKHYLTIFILSIAVFVSSVSRVSAQMEVTCPNSNPADSNNTGVNCSITSTQTRLFAADSIIAPGVTLSRNLVVINEDDDESCVLNMQVTDNSPEQDPSLAQVLRAAIYNGTTNYFGEATAGEATNNKNYQNLYDAGTISLGTLLPNSSHTFIWLATLDGETIGNEYQGKKTVFNFDLSFACGNPPAPTNTPADDDGEDDGGDDGGDTAGATTANPTSTPIPITASAFGGTGYRTILGAETEEQEATPSAVPTFPPEQSGEVAGATTCVPWKIYLPWILLIAQAGIILVVEHLMRQNHSWKKHLLAVVTTIVSIVLFYWLRECECYSGPSLLAWLCIWYWIVSVLLTIILKFFSYAFIEEVKE